MTAVGHLITLSITAARAVWLKKLIVTRETLQFTHGMCLQWYFI